MIENKKKIISKVIKRLLLHIGFPKTATTTLQEEVFLGLHNDGLINYLGRTVKSSHTKSGLSAFNGVDIVKNLRKYLVLNDPLILDTEQFVEDKLNVMSDEDLTFHGFFNSWSSNVNVDPLEFPFKIKQLLPHNIEVEILMVIRNQPDLIFSSFVQKYRFIYNILGKVTFKEVIEGKDSSFFSIYNFEYIANQYQKTLNANVHILLFEDFVNEPDLFWNQMSNILNYSSDKLQKYAGDKHYRKRNKSDGVIRVNYNKPSFYGKLISLFYGSEQKFMKSINIRHHMKFSILLKIEKRILLNTFHTHLTLPSEEEKQQLIEIFNESNRKLAINYKLDTIRLQKYNYFIR